MSALKALVHAVEDVEEVVDVVAVVAAAAEICLTPNATIAVNWVTSPGMKEWDLNKTMKRNSIKHQKIQKNFTSKPQKNLQNIHLPKRKKIPKGANSILPQIPTFT